MPPFSTWTGGSVGGSVGWVNVDAMVVCVGVVSGNGAAPAGTTKYHNK